MKKENPTVFRVVKLAAGQPVKAYKRFSGELGVEMDSADYIEALAVEIGSPALILTKSQLLEKLKQAASQVQSKMQTSTIAVAGLKVPPVLSE